jgi:Ca-activated chloride channel family protein
MPAHLWSRTWDGVKSRRWCARHALAWTVRAPRPRPALIFASALSALVAARLVAQQPIPDNRVFQSGVEITSLTATVTDKDGHPITGLPREVFEVYEDGVLQTITQFTRERVPIGLGVLLDISDSMFGKRMDDARAAVDKFLFELLDPADEFFLMAFNHKPHPLTGWTREQGDVRHALAGLRPSGGTAIYDTILDALPLIERRNRQRAAILVISDGADTASTATLRELRPALHRSDAFIYAIAIDSPERQPINTRVNAAALREITAENGGRTEIVQNSAQLDEAAARVAEELNSQYVLGYTPPRGADGQFHSLRVRIAGADYRVRARNGYVATPAGGKRRQH